jgi:Transposase DDE domain
LEIIVPHPLGVVPAGPVTPLQVLAGFRDGVLRCFGRWADTLFEITDALAGAGPVRSVPALMFEPVLRRGWGSLYQALEHGQVDAVAARRLLAGQVRAARVLLFAVDVSTLPRPGTRKTADVGMHYAAGRAGTGGTPAVAGWAMQWLCQVALDADADADAGRGSWALPLDVRRVATTGNANDLAAAQIADLCAAGVAGVPVFLLDAGYCPITLTQHRPAPAQLLVRLRSDRVFFARPPARVPGKPGRPRKHGARFALDEPGTWPPPDAELRTTGPHGATVWTRAWHHYHPEPRQRRRWAGTSIVEGTLIRQEQTSPAGHTQVWWLWWAGPADAFDLALLSNAYRHRYTVEHGYRFAKQDLGWTRHTPLDPAQAERWTWLVALAYAQLHLARPLTTDRRLPWERPCPPERLSPRRVRRAFRHITATLPTPARPPKPSRPGPGRPPGSTNKNPRPPHPVIKKGRPANTGHRKNRSPNAKPTPQP